MGIESLLPPPFLIADHPGLELLNSVGAPYGTEMDWVGSGTELLSWCCAVGLLAENEAKDLQEQLSADELDDLAKEVRDLREIYRTFVPDGAQPLIEYLNALLARGQTTYEIVPGGKAAAPQMLLKNRMVGSADLMAVIARAVADAICLDVPDRTRQCAGPTCTLWFRDTSKSNRRRWCSMSVCGNRSKAAAHRARHSGS